MYYESEVFTKLDSTFPKILHFYEKAWFDFVMAFLPVLQNKFASIF